MARYRIELCHGTASENQVIAAHNLIVARQESFEIRKSGIPGSEDSLHFGGQNYGVKAIAETLGVNPREIAGLVSSLSGISSRYRGHVALDFNDNNVLVRHLGQNPSRAGISLSSSERMNLGNKKQFILNPNDSLRVVFPNPSAASASSPTLFVRVTYIGSSQDVKER